MQIVMALADDANASLWQLMNVVKLAAFACEARRVLATLDAHCDIDTAMSERLKSAIPAHLGWTTHDDVTGDVLRSVAAQLEGLAEAGDRRVSTMADMVRDGTKKRSADAASLEGRP